MADGGVAIYKFQVQHSYNKSLSNFEFFTTRVKIIWGSMYRKKICLWIAERKFYLQLRALNITEISYKIDNVEFDQEVSIND